MSLLQRYLINLEYSKNRLLVMQERLNRLGIPFERIEAVDAKNLSRDDFLIDMSPSIEYPHQLRDGELACFLSHRKCWKKLVDSNSDWALILEDHCVFSSLASNYFKTTDWIPNGCEIVQFVFSNNPVYSNKQISLLDGNTLVKVQSSSPIGCSAYFISKRAAKFALKESVNIYSPVDNFLFGPWSNFSKTVDCWRLLGAIAKRDENTATTIQGRGTSNKTHNKKRLHPQRLMLKLLMKIHRIYLKKNYQYWFTK